MAIGLVVYNERNMAANRPPRAVAVVPSRGTPEVDETVPTEDAIREWKVAPDHPRYLSIPALHISSAIVRSVGVQADGKLGTPVNIFDTAWFNGSALPGSGSGALLIDGHNGGPTLDGVFKRLGSLRVGDKIIIERGDGQLFTYAVVENQTKSVADTDAFMGQMLQSAEPGREGLNLITCTGNWDNANLTFDQRVLIRAVLQN